MVQKPNDDHYAVLQHVQEELTKFPGTSMSIESQLSGRSFEMACMRAQIVVQLRTITRIEIEHEHVDDFLSVPVYDLARAIHAYMTTQPSESRVDTLNWQHIKSMLEDDSGTR